MTLKKLEFRFPQMTYTQRLLTFKLWDKRLEICMIPNLLHVYVVLTRVVPFEKTPEDNQQGEHTIFRALALPRNNVA